MKNQLFVIKRRMRVRHWLHTDIAIARSKKVLQALESAHPTNVRVRNEKWKGDSCSFELVLTVPQIGISEQSVHGMMRVTEGSLIIEFHIELAVFPVWLIIRNKVRERVHSVAANIISPVVYRSVEVTPPASEPVRTIPPALEMQSSSDIRAQLAQRSERYTEAHMAMTKFMQSLPSRESLVLSSDLTERMARLLDEVRQEFESKQKK